MPRRDDSKDAPWLISACSAPAPRATEPFGFGFGFGFGDRGHVSLPYVWLDHGRVVLLVKRKVIDPFAGVAGDVALDPRVVGERELLLDSDLELPGELSRPI